MPYTISIRAIDTAKILPGAPAISGRISREPGGPIETVTASAASFGPDLNFASTAIPPTGIGTVYVGNTRTSGDLCRSGPVGAWPASPAMCEIFTIPTSFTTFTGAALGAMAGGLAGSTIAIPLGITVAAGGLTGLMFAPTGITVTGVRVAPSPPNLLVVTVLGTIAFRQFFFATSTSFTATIALSIAPSGDALNRERIFNIGVVSSALNPGVITPGINAVLSLLAPLAAQFASGEIERLLNDAIGTAGRDALTQIDATASIAPGAAICANRVTITPGTLALEMLISNPLGPTIVRRAPPVTATLAAAISPTPVRNMQTAYTIHVTDAASGAPVENATVEIVSGSANGSRLARQATTDAAGNAHISIALRDRRVRTGTGRNATFELAPPTLSASKTGFHAVTQALWDPVT